MNPALHKVFVILRLAEPQSVCLLPNPGACRFPITTLGDGDWHRVALSITLERLELRVDCQLVESVSWSNYFGMGVTTEGLVIIGGLIEPFEIPFEVRACSFCTHSPFPAVKELSAGDWVWGGFCSGTALLGCSCICSWRSLSLALLIKAVYFQCLVDLLYKGFDKHWIVCLEKYNTGHAPVHRERPLATHTLTYSSLCVSYTPLPTLCRERGGCLCPLYYVAFHRRLMQKFMRAIHYWKNEVVVCQDCSLKQLESEHWGVLLWTSRF